MLLSEHVDCDTQAAQQQQQHNGPVRKLQALQNFAECWVICCTCKPETIASLATAQTSIMQ
jgi:hypothetical protein